METIARVKVVSVYLGNVLLGAVLAIVCSFASCAKAPSNQNLVRNGDLTQGYGEHPADWTHISSRYLEQGQGTEDFGWIHRPGAPGELWLIAHEINLIDWEQTVALDPGMYHLSTEIWAGDSDSLRGSGVDLQFGKNSLALKGFDLSVPSGWKRGDLYFKVGKRRKVQISCNLMGRSARVRSAFFRRISLVRLSGPPANGASLTDLDAYGDASVKQGFHGSRAFPRPEGDAWTVLAALLVFAAIAIYGWIMVGRASTD
jgi:hypothetical protein